MKKSTIGVCLILSGVLLLTTGAVLDWGFYAHRRITYQAIYSVPYPLHSFLRANQAYLTEQSVAPDKRRMLQKNEDIRHYIDLDHWEKQMPVDTLPKNWNKALFRHTTWYYEVEGRADSSNFPHEKLTTVIGLDSLERLFVKHLPYPHESTWQLDHPISTFENIQFEEQLTAHGINPWALSVECRRLTKAFEEHNKDLILSLLANISHYVADAHVPLHTTKNYNGQYTNQLGIHAFWETRIPELFSERFDYMVGRATYVPNLDSLFWQVVEESNALVPIVLHVEKKVRKDLDEMELNCFDMQKKMQPLPCENFAARFEKDMGHMVERRLQDAILAVASVWYTCWVNAGQPDLDFAVEGKFQWLEKGEHLDRLKEN